MTINTISLLKEDYPKLRVKITEKLRKPLFFNLNNLTESLAKSLRVNEVSLRRKLFNKRGYSLKLNELLFLGQKAKCNEKEILSNITDIKMGANAYWSNFPMRIPINEGLIEGIGYYVGDGRTKTNTGLSTVNTNIDVVKLFLKWLKKYFNAKIENIRINIFYPRLDFDVNLEKRKWSRVFKAGINSVKKKYKFKKHHKIIIEVYYSRTIAKLILNKLIPIIKERCSTNESLATAYIRGIMAAEGSPKYNEKSHQRAVHLKMKDKTEVKYVFKLLRFLGLTPSFLFSKQDGEWLVSISGFSELKKLDRINIFGSHLERKKKLKKILSNYHHQQTKKGQVRKFYLGELYKFEEEYGKHCTAKQLSGYIKRDRTRVINVLRELQRDGLLKGERTIKAGAPFKFTLTQAGKEFILEKSLTTCQPY
jgi:hypothetical protein